MTEKGEKMEVDDSSLEELKANAREVVEKDKNSKQSNGNSQNGVESEEENGDSQLNGDEKSDDGKTANGSDHENDGDESDKNDKNGDGSDNDDEKEDKSDKNGVASDDSNSVEEVETEEEEDQEKKKDNGDSANDKSDSGDEIIEEDDNPEEVDPLDDEDGTNGEKVDKAASAKKKSSDDKKAVGMTTPKKKKPASSNDKDIEEVAVLDDDDDEPSVRRSARKKTPKKYGELVEKEIIQYEEEDLMEVEEIKDDDSDIEEVTIDDDAPPPKVSKTSSSLLKMNVAGSSVSITKTSKSPMASNSGGKSGGTNVVTIDDLRTLQRLASSAKKNSLDDRSPAIDTQSLLASKMGSGVSITPARPRGGVVTPSGLNISPAGMTLGSGVTIKPNNSNSMPSTPVMPRVLPNNSSVTITGSGGVLNANQQRSMMQQQQGSGASSPAAGLTGLENTDPNLTDDTFVVEAPSFIVPYVYEKPPVEPIKEFGSSIKKMAEELEEKKKKEKEEETKKRREERQKKRDDGEEDVEDDTDEEEKEDKEKDGADKKDEKKVEGGEAKKDEPAKEEKKDDSAAKDPKDAYFTSTLGKFFMELGMNFVQEYVQKDLLRQQQKRAQKDKSAAVIHAISSLQKNLDDSREQNEQFHHSQKKCRFCSFRTESRTVMANHLETPHMKNFVYRCNFCEYETKLAHEVLFHMDTQHGIKGKLERAPYFHQCPQCPFEDNGKGKLTRHKVGCDKRFKPELNQTPEREWDPPAKIKPQPTRPGYAAPYAKNMMLAGTPTGNMAYVGGNLRPGMAVQGGRNFSPMQNAGGMNSPRFMNNMNNVRSPMGNMAGVRGRPVGTYKGPGGELRIPSPGMAMPNQQKQFRGMNHQQMLSGQQMLAMLNQQGLSVSQAQRNVLAGGIRGNSPSISITPLPNKNSPLNKGGAKGSPNQQQQSMKPGQPGAGQAKGSFVICEICDGYIKDLEQLRNHMQWIHKVKIHPKMIYNRPPLNCQKCQFRFFTDQGLERHLLGSHGLVTASMQDAANKGQDSGRCPVCGKVYQWKLLNHVAKDHGKTLKPAHLSYKCTVCTATFGQYKLFENHVYTAHSGVAKKVDKSKQQVGKAGGSSGSLVKAPVKLSNEISIVKKDAGPKPQPVGENEVINLDDEEEIDDVEKDKGGKSTTAKKAAAKNDEEEVIDLADTPTKKKPAAGESKKRELEVEDEEEDPLEPKKKKDDDSGSDD